MDSRMTTEATATALMRMKNGPGASAGVEHNKPQREVLQVLSGGANMNIFFNNNSNVVGKDLIQKGQLAHQQPGVIKENNFSRLRTGPSAHTDSVIPSSTAIGSGISIYTDEDETRSKEYAAENVENLPPQTVEAMPRATSTFPKQQPSHIEPASHAAQSQPQQIDVDDMSRAPLQEIPVRIRPVQSTAALLQQPAFTDRLFEVEIYKPDILEYLKEAEIRFRPKPDYMRKQPDINSNMRTILVDWVVEVCEEYRLNTETLYLSVLYVDRFLSFMSVVRSKLQLVGTSAMFIAAKYEEIYPPDVSDFVYITDDSYNKKQVLRMEQLILKVLNFDMAAPTQYAFVNLYASIEQVPEAVKHMALFLCELSLLYAAPFLQYLPSRIAAAALAYARVLLNYDNGRLWTRRLELMTGYDLASLQQVLCDLSMIHAKCDQMVQKAVTDKYKAIKYNAVASVETVELTKELFDQTLEDLARELDEAVIEI